MAKLSVFCVLILAFKYSTGYIVEPGPVVKATHGEVWPIPQRIESYESFFIVRPSEFQFQVVGENCQILQDAFARYLQIITDAMGQNRGRSSENEVPSKSSSNNKEFIANMDLLNVMLLEPCTTNDLPTVNMDEHYMLNISSTIEGYGLLTATSIWGALRGLETFSQLLYRGEDDTGLTINSTFIMDYPRFSHRGLLLDTSRHYIPLNLILKTIDAMSYNKLNVFHWHIVDDHSFPYQSTKFPEMSEKGAYHPLLIYTPTDVQTVIDHARVRGIRVIPEFDTPGHTRSWGLGIPELLTPCYVNGTPSGRYGPVDPTKNFTYSFLEELYQEVIQTFPDNYVHLGGDEVGFECWESNPNITEYMEKLNITNTTGLESMYIQRVVDMVDNLTAQSVVWEEVFTNGIRLPTTTIVHVWKEVGWDTVMDEVTRAGYPALLSACWYLDHLLNGGDWLKYYLCEPYSFPGNAEQKALLLGGEACMWAEAVNEYNVMSRVWPRASAAAEKLWSAEDADPIDHVKQRLEEHACRLNTRGIEAQPPNGPGVCL